MTGPGGPGIAAFTLRAATQAELDVAFPDAALHLSASEKSRYARYRQPRDRHAFATRRAFLRDVLARELGVEAGSVGLTEVGTGKPALAGTAAATLWFSQSATPGLTAVAVSRQGAVGVDVERTDRRVDYAAILAGFFTDRESNWVHGHPGETARQEAFLRLWTAVEATVKATGEGLASGLGDYRFDWETSSVRHHPGGGSWMIEHRSQDGCIIAVATPG